MTTMQNRASSLRELLASRQEPEHSRAREKMLKLLDEGGDDAFLRDHYAPGHFTASGFVLSPDGSSLLLIHHRKLGLWLQPGGHFEAEDVSAAGAAAREVTEETGVAGMKLEHTLIDLDVHLIPGRPEAPSHFHFDVRCLFRAPSWELTSSAEVLSARWFGLESLAEGGIDPVLGQTDESVVRVARRIAALR